MSVFFFLKDVKTNNRKSFSFYNKVCASKTELKLS